MTGPDDDERAKRLRSLWRHARDWWRPAREQMAADDDYVDGRQYTADEEAVLDERGQPAIVYNEIESGIRWLTGTQRRFRMDWRVVPREKHDTDLAKVKTDCLKYLSDVTRAPYERARAFEQAARSGVGWLETGVRGDAIDGEPIYHTAVDWREMWLDPASRAGDINADARFLFRSRALDLDVAISAWPDFGDALHAESFTLGDGDDPENDELTHIQHVGSFSIEGANDPAERRVVRVVECWYRDPATVDTIMGRGAGALHGAVYDDSDPMMQAFVQRGITFGVIDLVRSRRLVMRVALFTHKRGVLLTDSPSPYRHQRFPYTPIWGRRRGRDGYPYGPVRQARGAQDGLNKTMSKGVDLLSSRQVLAEDGAILDIPLFEERIAQSGAVITCIRKGALKDGSLEIQDGRELAAPHLELALHNAEFVRNSMGVTGEQLARETNAQSGVAIERRQTQGSTVTADLFDNLRLGMQLSGELMLRLIEQFWTDTKTVRITGERVERFVEINQQQADGSFANDIAASMSDYVVDQQDWRASTREAAVEAFAEIMAKLPQDVAFKLFDLTAEMMDIPMQDEVVKRIRQLNGQPDPLDEQAVIAAQEAQRAQQQAIEAQQQAELDKLRSEAERNRAAADSAVAAAQKAMIEAMPGALAAALQAISNPTLAAAADALMAQAKTLSATSAETTT